MPHSPFQAHPLFVLSLPTEILYFIFQYTLHVLQCRIRFDADESDRLSVKVDQKAWHQLLTLRSVCRRFRDVADNIPIWCNTSDFQLANVYPDDENLYPDRFSSLIFAPGRPYELQSQSIYVSLGRYRTVSDVLLHQEPINKNIDSITLLGEPECHVITNESLKAIIKLETLYKCHNVTKLRIESLLGINLCTLATNFPLLEYLHIGGLYGTHGDLGQLSHLKFLEIHELGIEECERSSFFFPLKSVGTLTWLSLRYGLGMPHEFDIHKLLAFVNLRHLWIEPLTGGVQRFLLQTDFKLLTFGTKLGWTNVEIDVQQLTEMFLAPCFQILERLTFCLSCWDAYVPDNYPNDAEDQATIVNAIISNMSLLQTLAVQMPVDIAWCRNLAALKSLRSISWQVVWTFLYEDYECWEIHEAFRSAFENFLSPPIVAIAGAI
jgi:hypothetical protein